LAESWELAENSAVRFDLISLRLEFLARDALHFPPGKAANVLRGAFGLALERAGASAFFDPSAADGPSGLADPPRPFVFRVRHLDGASFRAGDPLEVRLNLFTPAQDLVARAFEDAGREGFGPGRGRAELRAWHAEPIAIDLSPRPETHRTRIEFLTPTELKHEGRIAARPEFAILAARARDRIGALRALYGPAPLDLDFAAFGARAAAVRMTRCDLHEISVDRRSSRTGQTHPIGGFTGAAEYEGSLGEFLPFLEAARWTGVGRQAVWGKGELALSGIM
jgi:hypothetical protein